MASPPTKRDAELWENVRCDSQLTRPVTLKVAMPSGAKTPATTTATGAIKDTNISTKTRG
jgi:hypothetical protein